MPDPNVIRKRLVEIDDELRALPATSFAAKHALNVEADEIRAELRELLRSDLEEVADKWAGRDARKAAHNIDHETAAAMAAIPNPGSAA